MAPTHHSCSFTVTLTDYQSATYPTVTVPSLTKTFTVKIEPCKIVTYAPTSTISDTDYTIWVSTVDASLPTTTVATLAYMHFIFPTYVQTPLCGYTETWGAKIALTGSSLADMPNSFAQADITNQKILIRSTNLPDAGVYTVQILNTLDDGYWFTGTRGDPGTVNTDTTFQLTMIDPCYSTTINTGLTDATRVKTVADMDTSVRLGYTSSPYALTMVTQTFTAF